MKSKQLVTIVGGIPDPVGGVTTFVRRMAEAYPQFIGAILDLYPAGHKDEVGVEHLVLDRPVLTSLFLRLLVSVREPVYFNFSGARALLLLAFLPKLGESRWAVTLHNGDVQRQLARYGRLRRLVIALMARGLSRCKIVGVISARQGDFYRSLGVPERKMTGVSPFFGLETSVAADIQSDEINQIKEWRAAGHKVFVASGYPTSIYRHEEVLDRFERLWSSGTHSIRLALFLYGNDAEGALQRISDRVARLPFAVRYWRCRGDVFLEALRHSSAYIRMNSVDSYGVAVAEAIALGKPVLATNVCERYPGAILVPVDDFDALERFVMDPPAGPEGIMEPGNGVELLLRRLVDAR